MAPECEHCYKRHIPVTLETGDALVTLQVLEHPTASSLLLPPPPPHHPQCRQAGRPCSALRVFLAP